MRTFDNLKYKFERFSIAEKLIVVNVFFFVVPFFLQTFFYLFKIPNASFFSWFELLPNFDVLLYRPWTLITYGFLHGGFRHILWNMLLLFFASRLYLNLFSERQFLKNYFLGIITGGLVFLISYNVFPVFNGIFPPLVGSSAGVMSILIFVATYTPNQEVRVIFFNIKLQYIGIALVILDILQIPNGNAGGRLAHLGGALIGFIYANQLQKGNDIGAFLDRIWSYVNSFFVSNKKNNMRTVHRSKNRTKENPSNLQQEKIDSILDKISKSGYESLTQKEKDFLFKAGKNN